MGDGSPDGRYRMRIVSLAISGRSMDTALGREVLVDLAPRSPDFVVVRLDFPWQDDRVRHIRAEAAGLRTLAATSRGHTMFATGPSGYAAAPIVNAIERSVAGWDLTLDFEADFLDVYLEARSDWGAPPAARLDVIRSRVAAAKQFERWYGALTDQQREEYDRTRLEQIVSGEVPAQPYDL